MTTVRDPDQDLSQRLRVLADQLLADAAVDTTVDEIDPVAGASQRPRWLAAAVVVLVLGLGAAAVVAASGEGSDSTRAETGPGAREVDRTDPDGRVVLSDGLILERALEIAGRSGDPDPDLIEWVRVESRNRARDLLDGNQPVSDDADGPVVVIGMVGDFTDAAVVDDLPIPGGDDGRTPAVERNAVYFTLDVQRDLVLDIIATNTVIDLSQLGTLTQGWPDPETTPSDRLGALINANGVVQANGSTRIDIPLVTGSTATLVLSPAAVEEVSMLDLAQHVEVACAGCGEASVSVTSPGHGGELGEPIQTLSGGAFVVESSIGRLLRWDVDGWLLEAPLGRVPAGQEQALADALGFVVVDGWPRLDAGRGLEITSLVAIPVVLARDHAEDDGDAPLEVQFNQSTCEPGTVTDVGSSASTARHEVCLTGGNAALVIGDPERVAAVSSGLSG